MSNPASILTVAVTVLAVATPVQAQTVNGQQIYKMRCQACHSPLATGPSVLAPVMAGVVGRKAGSAKFNYSPAMTSSKLIWSKDVLDKFLAGPTKLVPGTRMVMSVSDAAQRKALVEYLATLR